MLTINIKQLDADTRNNLLVAFQNAGESIKIGDAGEDVQVIEQLLEEIDPNFYNGPPDDQFGKGVRKAVLRFQESRLLKEDGVVGPKTRHELVLAWRSGWHPGQVFMLSLDGRSIPTFGPNHPTLGKLPGTVLGRVEGGKVSNFGGPLDPGDRIYGQAYLNDAKSPEDFLRRHPYLESLGIAMTKDKMWTVTRFECARGHTWDGFPEDTVCKRRLNSGVRCNLPAISAKPVLESLDKWPTVQDWRGRWKSAGESWCLDPDGCYCAIRRYPAQRHRRNEKCPVVLIWNPKTGKMAAAMNTDYGPATSTEKLIDVSPGIERHLGMRTGGYVRVAWGLDNDTPRLIG